jgi:hypothetical protein
VISPPDPSAERTILMNKSPDTSLESGSDDLDRRIDSPFESMSLLRPTYEPELEDALDRVEAELSDDAERRRDAIEVAVASAERAGFALSAGLLAMVTRGTSLVAMALSALPVWSRVDPLAVLAVSERTRRENRREQRDAEAQEDEANHALGKLLDRRPEKDGPDEPSGH